MKSVAGDSEKTAISNRERSSPVIQLLKYSPAVQCMNSRDTNPTRMRRPDKRGRGSGRIHSAAARCSSASTKSP